MLLSLAFKRKKKSVCENLSLFKIFKLNKRKRAAPEDYQAQTHNYFYCPGRCTVCVYVFLCSNLWDFVVVGAAAASPTRNQLNKAPTIQQQQQKYKLFNLLPCCFSFFLFFHTQFSEKKKYGKKKILLNFIQKLCA